MIDVAVAVTRGVYGAHRLRCRAPPAAAATTLTQVSTQRAGPAAG